MVLVGGEITTDTYVDIQTLVRDVVKEIGYTDPDYGIDYESIFTRRTRPGRDGPLRRFDPYCGRLVARCFAARIQLKEESLQCQTSESYSPRSP